MTVTEIKGVGINDVGFTSEFSRIMTSYSDFAKATVFKLQQSGGATLIWSIHRYSKHTMNRLICFRNMYEH